MDSFVVDLAKDPLLTRILARSTASVIGFASRVSFAAGYPWPSLDASPCRRDGHEGSSRYGLGTVPSVCYWGIIRNKPECWLAGDRSSRSRKT